MAQNSCCKVTTHNKTKVATIQIKPNLTPPNVIFYIFTYQPTYDPLQTTLNIQFITDHHYV